MAKVYWKKSGGVVVITKTSSALSRWVLSKNLGSHIGAQTSTMSFNTHLDDRLIHRESARERQKPDNEAENALHHKTLGRSSLKQKIMPATSQIQQSLVQVVLKDKVLEQASRKTILHVDKRILCFLVIVYEFRNEIKMQAIVKH